MVYINFKPIIQKCKKEYFICLKSINSEYFFLTYKLDLLFLDSKTKEEEAIQELAAFLYLISQEI